MRVASQNSKTLESFRFSQQRTLGLVLIPVCAATVPTLCHVVVVVGFAVNHIFTWTVTMIASLMTWDWMKSSLAAGCPFSLFSPALNDVF